MSTSQSLGRHSAAAARPARSRHAAPRKGRRRVTLVTAGAIAFTGIGSATAAWLVMGSGDATGKAITASKLDITPGTASPDLYPGAKGTVTVTVTNTNSFPVRINKAAFRDLVITPLGTSGSCAVTTDVKLGDEVTLTPVPLAAASPSTTADTATITIPNAIEMLAGASNGCQGDTFTLVVDLTGESAA